MPVSVRSHNGVWVLYGSWFVWKWAQRFPEDIQVRDNPYVQHRRAA